MLPDYLLLLISQRSPDLAHLQCKDSAHSHQCHLAAPQVNTDELCLHHLPASFHEKWNGSKKHPQQNKLKGRKLPTILSTLLSLSLSFEEQAVSNRLSLLSLPLSDSNCKAGVGEDTSIRSSLSPE